ncbi:hypothetical protein H5410_007686 [Solanum commersonii]|uniref:TCP domain-containing protein n=1 Tax=Solanum commersonii TaxID=4109 RepID=A0A9J6ADU7_SOLCO|nr:hypothetical protein H5410_007686 [Solanum commersonii]
MNHQFQVSDEEDGSEEEEEEEVFQENGIRNLQNHFQNQQMPQSLCKKPAKWADFTVCEQELNKGTRIMKPKRAKTDVIEGHGGRIIRATGRKDRHSKVSTAKGPKDRRVRLSPNTAIQFYDVQDRLGYDRPSKAMDWLIKEAKAAIDALGEFPNNFHCTKLNPKKMQYSFDQEQSSRFSQENRGVPNSEYGVQDNQQESLQDDTILSSGNHHHQGSFLTTTSVNHFPSVLSENQVFSHREPLQSSFFPLMSDPLSTQLETLSYGFANDGFSGLISSASRIQGEEEQATFFSAS